MDFTTLQSRVQSNIGRPNLNIPSYINGRQREICRSNFSFLWVSFANTLTVAGTQDYPLPANFKDDLHVYWLNNGQRQVMNMIDLASAWETFGTTPDTKNAPSAWVLNPTTFSVWPIPDGVYTIGMDGYAALTDLVSPSDHNYLTDLWPELLIAGAIADSFLEVQMSEDANIWEQRFQKYLRDLHVQDVERALAGTMMLEPRSGPHR